MNAATPEQIQRHKAVLEGAILEMVKQFEQRTGTDVRSITVVKGAHSEGEATVQIDVTINGG